MRPSLLLATGLAAHALPAASPVIPGVAAAFRIPRRVEDAGGVILTFDDGPHPQGTAATLEILARKSAPATFFLAGEQVERYPALAAEIVAAGHEVGLHCHCHRNQLRLWPAAIVEDMRRGEAAIVEACERMPRLYRPPYGIFSVAGLWIARRRHRPLLWSRWGRDWARHATADSIAFTAANGARSGDVILLHDADHYSVPGSWRRTVEAVPRILDAVASRGLPVVRVP